MKSPHPRDRKDTNSIHQSFELFCHPKARQSPWALPWQHLTDSISSFPAAFRTPFILKVHRDTKDLSEPSLRVKHPIFTRFNATGMSGTPRKQHTTTAKLHRGHRSELHQLKSSRKGQTGTGSPSLCVLCVCRGEGEAGRKCSGNVMLELLL